MVYVWRGEFFHVAVVRGEIRNGSGIAEARNFFAATAADGSVGIVANLAAGEVGHVGSSSVVRARRMRLLACPRRRAE